MERGVTTNKRVRAEESGRTELYLPSSSATWDPVNDHLFYRSSPLPLSLSSVEHTAIMSLEATMIMFVIVSPIR